MAEEQAFAAARKTLHDRAKAIKFIGHPAPPIYRYFATGLGASMWFFLMYRAKKDGAVLLGWKHPWDH